jgi:P27 family predicted phage terminase small subunit
MTGGGKAHHSRHRRPGPIKELEGNRAKQGKAKLKPDPRGIGQPRMPDHLTEIERELWADVVASLPVGLLSRADDAVLERMATAWARWRRVKIKIDETGDLVKSSMGPVRSPLYPVLHAAEREMQSCGEVLGLSPVSRARLVAPGAAAEDPMELLLGMDGDPAGAWSTLPRTKN